MYTYVERYVPSLRQLTYCFSQVIMINNRGMNLGGIQNFNHMYSNKYEIVQSVDCPTNSCAMWTSLPSFKILHKLSEYFQTHRYISDIKWKMMSTNFPALLIFFLFLLLRERKSSCSSSELSGKCIGRSASHWRDKDTKAGLYFVWGNGGGCRWCLE